MELCEGGTLCLCSRDEAMSLASSQPERQRENMFTEEAEDIEKYQVYQVPSYPRNTYPMIAKLQSMYGRHVIHPGHDLIQ